MPKPSQQKKQTFILGIDLGTSGMRASLVDIANNHQAAIFSEDMPFPLRKDNISQQDPFIWVATLESLLKQVIDSGYAKQVKHIIANATSSSVLLVDENGHPQTPALMYDDKQAQAEAIRITEFSGSSGANGASSTLAKVMFLEADHLSLNHSKSIFICHQLDFINYFLTGHLNQTDENNALKLGFDSQNYLWPSWIKQLTQLPLPEIHKPGDLLGHLNTDSNSLEARHKFAQKWLPQFPQNTQVYFGTTDSIAAFLATGANQVGDAVSSLGSTIALKIITPTPIFSAKYGIYSHKLGNAWLAGGASNAGGAVLLKFFNLEELEQIIPKIDLNQSTSLNYYPLVNTGERFPISDANLAPKVTPRPDSNPLFLQGLLEGLTRIEKLGFERLAECGAVEAKRIFTAGGGLKNTAWMSLRDTHLKAPLEVAKQTQAAFGVTQLIRDKLKPVQT